MIFMAAESVSISCFTLLYTDSLHRIPRANSASLSGKGAEKNCMDFGLLAHLPLVFYGFFTVGFVAHHDTGRDF